MTVGSLFAGIGGFDLGFSRAGFTLKWQIEIDPFCQAVLAEHWPGVTRYADVRAVHGPLADPLHHEQEVGTGAATARAGRREQPAGIGTSRGVGRGSSTAGVLDSACLEPVDVICGGFPCQPHSLAGRRGASADDRDLWPEFARLIRDLRPRWVVAENVPGLLSSEAGRFFGAVLGDLAACGYDAEWQSLPASAFGAPHRRDRVWIVAYPTGAGGRYDGGTVPRADAGDVADAGLQGLPLAESEGGDARIFQGTDGGHSFAGGGQWAVEPDVGRVAHGVPARVDRLRGLGNAIVPPIAEWIARRILAAEGLTAPSPATSATLAGL